MLSRYYCNSITTEARGDLDELYGVARRYKGNFALLQRACLNCNIAGNQLHEEIEAIPSHLLQISSLPADDKLISEAFQAINEGDRSKLISVQEKLKAASLHPVKVLLLCCSILTCRMALLA